MLYTIQASLKKILIVDDEHIEHVLMKNMFAKTEVDVELHSAYTLKQASHLLKFNSYDCALVDLNLPDGDGLSLLSKHDDTPMIIVTGSADDALTTSAIRSGAQDYLVKGEFSLHQLKRTICFAVERNRLVTELARSQQELKESNARFKELARIDPLTGLSNRRALMERLERLVKEARRGREFALLMADIDHFKQLNDTHGHAVGDQVLAQVARWLKESAREVDFVARYGGEEFTLLLVDVGREEALRAAERLCAGLPEAIQDPYPITASFGLSTFEPGMTEAQLFETADRAMYHAKKYGRNRVEAHASKQPTLQLIK